MSQLLKHISRSFVVVIIYSIGMFGANSAYAQHCKFFTVSYKDSLVADNETNVLMNVVKLRNPNYKTVRLDVSIKVPPDWRNLSKDVVFSGKEVQYIMPPHSERNISINLLKQPQTSANWDSVIIDVKVPHVLDTHQYYYRLRSQPNPRFTAQHITEDIELAAYSEFVPLSVRIKNTGNVDDQLTLNWQNQYLVLDENITFRLARGKDTVYTYMLKIPRDLWHGFHKQGISLTIKDSGIYSYVHPFTITRPRHVVKESKSPYKLLPILIEGGLIEQNNSMNYYYGVRGDIQIADRNDLHFYYKSKQFGNEVYGIQQNMYLVDYHYHDWRFAAGMIQSNQRYFMSNGRGFSIAHSWNEHANLTVAAILRDPNFYYTNDNISVTGRYRIGKFNVTQMAVANMDKTNYLNGYVYSNDVQLVNTSRMGLTVMAGIGLEEKTRNMPDVNKQLWGMTAGYKYNYHTDDWNISSNIEYCSVDFPGINKGMRIQMHQVTRNFKRTFAGLFYSANYLNATYFRDTLYNTDILQYNTERLGTTFGYKDRTQNILFNTGILNESGAGNIYDLNHLVFMDISYSWNPKRNVSFSINSQNAYKGDVGTDHQMVFITSSMASFNVGWPGVMATYTRRPVFESEAGGNRVKEYDETVSAGPFLKFNLFRNHLSGMIKYTFSKSAYDEVARTSLGGGFGYNNEKIGVGLQVTANIPTSKVVTNGHALPVSEGRFLTATLTKQLNIPVVTHRRFYNLKMLLFDDANNNGHRDANEELLGNMKINVNNEETLVTNKHGVASYRNIEQGSYALELGILQAKGLVPVNGIMQSVTVSGNTTIEVPYKKGRVITGNIKIVRDSFSNVRFTPDGIKVTATDTSGRSFVTIADETGDFYFSVPAGIYTVSLNSAAFVGSDFKPETISFTVDLMQQQKGNVSFTIKQKPRKVNFRDLSSNK